MKELKELAADDSRIIFTGFQSGKVLEELFSNAYLVAHPSESEGLSVSVLEAMSYSKPVVVSDIPENLEAIGEHGMSAQNKNVEDLAEKIQYLLDNQDIAERLGSDARTHVLTHYNWDDIAQNTSELYKHVKYAKNTRLKRARV